MHGYWLAAKFISVSFFKYCLYIHVFSKVYTYQSYMHVRTTYMLEIHACQKYTHIWNIFACQKCMHVFLERLLNLVCRFSLFVDIVLFRTIYRKPPVLESLFNKAAALQLATFLKRDSSTGVFLWLLQTFKNTYFT